MLARMRDSGVGYCAMEVSSHALDQERVRGLTFHSALFTNLTQDHLDYHKDIETYFGAKAKLFEGLSPDTTALINIDDPFGQRLTEMTRARVVTYAVDRPATVKACDVRMDMEHTEFTLDCAGESEKVSLRLIGRHNVYNALAAYAWARQAGFTHEQIKSAIGDFCAVPGRLERLDSRRGFSIFVDYAHTEDALKNVLSALRQLCTHKIIVVFGCGGDRDRTKRPRMGKVVSELADLAIITSDNPRSEDPQDIIRDIAAGIPKDNFCIIPERREAIQRSLSLAQPGDIVLIAGKGHEDYQVIQGKTIHFDDREAVRECLRSTS
jgi:UDP-N-acetylmuramyl-tripeptide synthetase